MRGALKDRIAVLRATYKLEPVNVSQCIQNLLLTSLDSLRALSFLGFILKS
jgi:hypothetical protein